jgi:hypothetical protein
VVIDARALNLWPAHDPITAVLQASIANTEAVMIAGRWRTRSMPPVPSPAHDAASCARSCAGTFVAKPTPIMNADDGSATVPAPVCECKETTSSKPLSLSAFGVQSAPSAAAVPRVPESTAS